MGSFFLLVSWSAVTLVYFVYIFSFGLARMRILCHTSPTDTDFGKLFLAKVLNPAPRALTCLFLFLLHSETIKGHDIQHMRHQSLYKIIMSLPVIQKGMEIAPSHVVGI